MVSLCLLRLRLWCSASCCDNMRFVVFSSSRLMHNSCFALSADPEQKVRETMVKCLVNFLTTQYSETDLCADVNEALTAIITRDPTHDIRLMGIHQVCDLAHGALVSGSEASETTGVESSNKKRAPPISVVAPELLKAIGNRVSSKNKTEHKDAITGLAQIYHKHYLRKKLMYVQEGGDDVSIDEILDVWKVRNGVACGIHCTFASLFLASLIHLFFRCYCCFFRRPRQTARRRL